MRKATPSRIIERNLALVCALSLAVTSLAPAAQAEETTAAGKPAPSAEAKPEPTKPPSKKTQNQARKAYGEGQKAFEAGDFAAALVGFSKAWELIPSPHAEYWIAMSLDKQEKVEETITAYERFLANPKAAEIGEEKLAAARARHAELKAKLPGEVSLTTEPPGAMVSVDGEAQAGETPMILKLPAGMHKISMTLTGYDPKEMELEVKGGERTEQKLALTLQEPEPAPPPPPAPEPEPEPVAAPPPPKSMVPAYVTLGIAGAGLITGTIFGIRALGAKSDFDDNPTVENADDVDQNALIADMSFGIALTLGVTGIVLLTSDADEGASPAEAAASKLTVAPYVGKTSGGAVARLVF